MARRSHERVERKQTMSTDPDITINHRKVLQRRIIVNLDAASRGCDLYVSPDIYSPTQRDRVGRGQCRVRHDVEPCRWIDRRVLDSECQIGPRYQWIGIGRWSGGRLM